MISSLAELADELEQQLDSREPYSLRMTTGRAIVKALREKPRMTTVEFCGRPVAAPCAIEEQCQYGKRIEESLDFNRLRAGDRRALFAEHQPVFDAYYAALDPVQADAARYRWLKERWSTGHGAHHVEWRLDIGCAEVYGLEALIDKAIAAKELE